MTDLVALLGNQPLLLLFLVAALGYSLTYPLGVLGALAALALGRRVWRVSAADEQHQLEAAGVITPEPVTQAITVTHVERAPATRRSLPATRMAGDLRTAAVRARRIRSIHTRWWSPATSSPSSVRRRRLRASSNTSESRARNGSIWIARRSMTAAYSSRAPTSRAARSASSISTFVSERRVGRCS